MENFKEAPYSLTKYIVVPLSKPIFGCNFSIRDKWINMAKRMKKLLLIRTPDGQEIITPQQYLSESKKILVEKYIPGHPMTMYQRNLKLSPLQDIDKYRMDW